MFPYYLAMGMPSEEFWHKGDAKAYREAYKIRKEEWNWAMWLQGLYFYHAVRVALSNAFSKNSKDHYMEKPFEIFPPDEEELERKQEEEAKELERRLNAFAEKFNGRK